MPRRLVRQEISKEKKGGKEVKRIGRGDSEKKRLGKAHFGKNSLQLQIFEYI